MPASAPETAAMSYVEAVAPARDSLDACLVFPSMPAVMKHSQIHISKPTIPTRK